MTMALAAGQKWRPKDGKADREIARIDLAPTGRAASHPAIWFSEGGRQARSLPEPQFRNWISLTRATLVPRQADDQHPILRHQDGTTA